MGNRTNLYYRTPDNLTAYYSEWPPQRSGLLRPFSDIFLFARNANLPLDKSIADCFFFRPSETGQNGPQRAHHENWRTRLSSPEESHTAAPGGESGAAHRPVLLFPVAEHPQIHPVDFGSALPHETLLLLRQITTGFIAEKEMQSGFIHRLVMLRIPESSCETHDETRALRDAQRVLQEVVVQQIPHH